MDQSLEISFGRHREDKTWKNEYLTWDEILDRLREVRRTEETIAEYDAMSREARDAAKNGPGFVGGFIRGGRRKKEFVESRSLITLDADTADETFERIVELELLGVAYALYSTHSYRPEAPKYRLVVPLDRAVSPDEFSAIARKLAEGIGMRFLDPTTSFKIHQLMYLPSCSADADPILIVGDGDPLEVDSILAQYQDWTDLSEWPRHPRELRAPALAGKKAEDPREKQGIIGMFCRAYTIEEGIEEFLSDVYEAGSQENRYTYALGHSANGLEIYPDQELCYSHQDSDPAADGHTHNLFDLVRIHLFGEHDAETKDKTPVNKRPSQLEAERWAASLPEVKRLQHWFSKVYGFNTARTIQNAFTEAVHGKSFHPIIDYLEAQDWDGIDRAETIFIDYLGAEDSHYVRQATRKMLLAAVTRIYRPGCKFDQMLVLNGPQGAGKSSLLAKLGREWFSDSLRTFDNKEAGEHLQSGWLFEIGELSALKKTEVEEVKAFLSKTEDRYRVAYDRQVSEFPRKCVFFGTTNSREFLQDVTGNRRFWPVDVDPESARYSHWDRLDGYQVGQIWAEVLTWFKAGETLSLDAEALEAAEASQAAHMESDPLIGIIEDWLDEDDDETGERRTRICAAQVWAECLGKRRGDMSNWESKKLTNTLRRIPGWAEREGRARVKGYGVQTVFDKI